MGNYDIKLYKPLHMLHERKSQSAINPGNTEMGLFNHKIVHDELFVFFFFLYGGCVATTKVNYSLVRSIIQKHVVRYIYTFNCT